MSTAVRDSPAASGLAEPTGRRKLRQHHPLTPYLLCLPYLVLLLTFASAMIWIGTWIGLKVRSADAVMGIAFTVVFPLTFLSSAFVPINSLPTDVMFIGFFGIVGYALIKFGFEPAPMLLGFVLGKLMEENLRRALLISRGDMMTFLDHPISAGLLAVALVILGLALLPTIRKGRDEVFVE